MAVARIDKRTDPSVRFLRKVRDGEDAERVFCEGLHLVEELLRSGWPPQEVFCTPEMNDKARALLLRYQNGHTPIRVMADHVMSFVSLVESAPGIVAIAKKRRPAALADSAVQLALVLSGVQLPQNVGNMVRTAEAAGVTSVWTTRTTADPLHPKALRGSSGSAFRLPVHRAGSLAEAAAALRRDGVALIAATQHGDTDYDCIDWTRPSALVLGSEGGGFTDDELALFDEKIRIPMTGAVESLNVGSAAAVCLFEAARQRRKRSGGKA